MKPEEELGRIIDLEETLYSIDTYRGKIGNDLKRMDIKRFILFVRMTLKYVLYLKSNSEDMEKVKVLIIIPAYNEAGNIESVIDNIVENYPMYDYIVVNDGSKDNTRDICRKRGYEYLNLSINLGIGGAVQTGYKYARDKDYDVAVQIDGDGQHDIIYLEKMLAFFKNGEADIVIGSRFIKKEGFQSSVARRTGIKMLSWLIFLCTGCKIKDVTSGFRAVNRKFIKIYAENYPNDYPEPEAIVSAVMHGGVIKECPVVMRERENGISSINPLKSVYYMLKVTLAILICRISFGVRRGSKMKK